MLAACVVLLAMVSTTAGAPVVVPKDVQSNQTLDCTTENADVYDQRQNGTENYRIHVNGVVVLVAPPETVLQAAQLSGVQMGGEAEKTKPSPATSTAPVGVLPPEGNLQGATQTPHSNSQDNNKLMNLLHMFKSIKHETESLMDHPKY